MSLIDELRARVDARPGDAHLRVRLGRALVRSGAPDAAIGVLAPATRAAPGPAAVWLGRAHLARGERRTAAGWLRRAWLHLPPGLRRDRVERVLRDLGVDERADDAIDLAAIVGESPATEAVRVAVAGVLAGDPAAEAPVLIAGPPGTGKALVAEVIHANGPLRAAGFHVVPVAAQEDVGQALFGRQSRPGLLSEPGTVVVDGVERLPLALERRLASALRRGRCPGPGRLPVHARCVFTAADLDRAPGGLRKLAGDRVVTTRPLADRREDVPVLAAHFARRLPRPVEPEPELLEALAGLSWPGNVRQLERVVRRLAARGRLSVADLPAALGDVADLPWASAVALEADAGLDRALPPESAAALDVCPAGWRGDGALQVVAADPLLPDLAPRLRRLSGRRIELFVASADTVAGARRHCYGTPAAEPEPELELDDDERRFRQLLARSLSGLPAGVAVDGERAAGPPLGRLRDALLRYLASPERLGEGQLDAVLRLAVQRAVAGLEAEVGVLSLRGPDGVDRLAHVASGGERMRDVALGAALPAAPGPADVRAALDRLGVDVRSEVRTDLTSDGAVTGELRLFNRRGLPVFTGADYAALREVAGYLGRLVHLVRDPAAEPSDAELADYRAARAGVAVVDAEGIAWDEALWDAVGRESIRLYGVLPRGRVDGGLDVVVADPRDSLQRYGFEAATGERIARATVAPADQLERVLARLEPPRADETQELPRRLVYYGPTGAGKRTTLEVVRREAPEVTGELGEAGGGLLRLPVRPVDGCGYELTTLSGEVPAAAWGDLLREAAGVVFVADSDARRLEEAVLALRDLEGLLARCGRDLAQVPLVFQWNKQDLVDALPAETLRAHLNFSAAPQLEAIAPRGVGVFPALVALDAEVRRRERWARGAGEAAPLPRSWRPVPARPAALGRGAVGAGSAGSRLKLAATAAATAAVLGYSAQLAALALL